MKNLTSNIIEVEDSLEAVNDWFCREKLSDGLPIVPPTLERVEKMLDGTGRDPQEALNLGWAHGALLTTYHGDTTMATLGEVEAFARGGSARVQR